MPLDGNFSSHNDRSPALIVGGVLSIIWTILLLGFWLLVPVQTATETGGIFRLVIVIGVIMPFVVIWLAVAFARKMGELRKDYAELQADIAQMARLSNKAMPRPAQTSAIPSDQPQSPPTVTVPSATTGSRQPPRPAAATPRRTASTPGQTSMDFETPEPAHIPSGTLVLALNFPDDANDHETIAALRAALKDPETARVLRAAQDVVTLLAGHGIFMDDLPPQHTSPAIWRQFAEGERGKSAASIGGIHEAEALEIVTNLLRSDEIFRDTAHHFLRHFDTLLSRRLPQLDDAHIGVLTDTRSARAFMLIGRAAGVFGQAEP